MVLSFWAAVGIWRSDVWPHDALSGLVIGDGGALGYTAVFGTLVPPLFAGMPAAFSQGDGFGGKVGACWFAFMGNLHGLLAQRSGVVIVIGVGVCVLGIWFAGAGRHLEGEELSVRSRRLIFRSLTCGWVGGCDVLRHYERVFRVWAGGGESDQGAGVGA